MDTNQLNITLPYKAFIIDIDGVLISDEQRIPGALEIINTLSEQQIPFILITNTTRKSRIAIWNNLKRLGFNIKENQILTAPIACVEWLKERNAKNIFTLISGSVINEFKDFVINAATADYVIIGDMGQDLNFEKLNTAFRLVMNGAKIIALQKNRYWQKADGLTMDAGAMVAALEFSTRKRATILGKPRKAFFMEAVKQINLPMSEIAVIGDDLETDVGGAQRAGLGSIAVKTGKFPSYNMEKENIRPDFILDSIADLVQFI